MVQGPGKRYQVKELEQPVSPSPYRFAQTLKVSSDRAPTTAIIAPNFKFQDMGIGGLDNEFSTIFRRAFASRVFPPGLIEKLGITHTKGTSALQTVRFLVANMQRSLLC